MCQRRRGPPDFFHVTVHSVICDMHRSASECPCLPPCPLSIPAGQSLMVFRLPVCPLRWAQFFICPLMIRDAIDREVEAVDSGECLSPVFLLSLPLLITAVLCCSPVLQSTSSLSRRTPTGRRCCLAVWPNRGTRWASSAGVS